MEPVLSSSQRFQVLERIGKGAYGEVFLALHKRSGEKVAIKMMTKADEEEGASMDTLKEIKMLQAMKQDNVVRLKEVTIIKRDLGLVFEYMENDLLGLVSRPDTKFSTPQIKCYLKQLLMGVHYLHTNKIIHRDIKPSNILVNNAGQLKLADFGMAIVREDHDHRPMSCEVVTLWYRAPEVLLGSQHYGTAIDMWAVGCVFAEMLLRGPILPGKNEQEQVQRIFDLCGTPYERIWAGVSKLPLYNKFVKDSRQRGSNHLRQRFRSLDSKALDLLERMLTLDPAKRATAFEALDSDYLWSDPMPCDPSTLPKHIPMNEYKAMFQRAQQVRLQQGTAKQARLEQGKRKCLPLQEIYEPRKRQCLPWMRARHQNACK